MMLLPGRNENIQSCFVCGAGCAIWLLNSSPTNGNIPFFPFLAYQKTPQNANKLDCNGRCLACNVCYVFLMQQWKTYQQNKTPIIKRLYWLKRPTDEYNIVGIDNGKCLNEMLYKELENTPASSQNYIPNSHHGRSVNNIANNPGSKDILEEDENERESNVDIYEDELSIKCPLCSKEDRQGSMKNVLTVPQSLSNVPFYSRISLGKNGMAETGNREGRMLVCSICHSKLYRQWLEFEKLSISWNDREFLIDSTEISRQDSENVTCFLCYQTFPCDSLSALYCKKVSDKPFYPFLKNLPSRGNAVSICCDEGITYGCIKCQSFLNQQWDVFEETGVPQEERVYRFHPSQPLLKLSEINPDKVITCFICAKEDKVRHLKRIYCNPGANMNLGFLRSFPHNKDGFFCEKTGETFVCVSCFKELRQHWLKYRLSLFASKDDYPKGKCENSLTVCPAKPSTLNTCEICHSVITEEAMDLNIYPPTSDNSENKPFFPLLNELCSVKDKPVLSSCRLCALNLLNQWASFETSNNTEKTDRYERSYKHNEFLCYVCNASVSRERIKWESIDNIKESIEIKASPISVRFDKDVAICNECKINHVKVKVKLEEADSLDPTTAEESLKEERPEVESGMKATATVSPFMNLTMRSHSQEHSNPSSSSASSNSNEGSFAAALRKLAQQAPGFPIPVIPRERRTSPLPKAGAELMSSGIIPHPSPHQQALQGSRIPGAPSIMAPVNPHSSSLSNTEKQEMLIKATYSHMHSREHGHQLKDVIGRHPNRPLIAAGSYPYPERDDHHHRRSQDQCETHTREVFETNRRNPITSSPVVSLSTHSLKERPSSSIGLVHPQPVRKHEEENIKSSSMNSMHYPSRDTTASMRPISPTELPRYGPFLSPRQHQHPRGGQTSCPVHGHESSHQHDERRERPPGIPFDPPNHVQRDYHNHHTQQHPRLREEIQFLHGRPHPLERKEQHIQSHHALEEDLRRRGLDYRWPGLPPHLLDEQYRRHVLNGGHEYAPFKEPPHGQVYVPHIYYGRDYPIPVEPYIGHGVPPNSEALQRHGPPVSPRLIDYSRRGEREHSLPERSRSQFEAAERRAEDRREKERTHNVMRTSSIDSVKSQRRTEESLREKETHSCSPGSRTEEIKESPREETSLTEDTSNAPVVLNQMKLHGQIHQQKIPFFKGVEPNFLKPAKRNDVSQANSIDSLLSCKLLPDPKTELAAASILANMNRISQSPCSDEVESLTSISGLASRVQPDKPLKKEEEDDDQQSTSFEGEQPSEEKLLYMVTLGLVPHNQKRALEDDYERKRWDRKFRKFRGRPKKRSKRESTDESCTNDENRPGSELDFYSGPMTRHKQQLLQEQECLLEQIQRQNNSDTSEDTNENIKLLRSMGNKDENCSSHEALNTEHSGGESSSYGKSFSKNKTLGDSSESVSNMLYPSRLLAILRDDQQKINSSSNSSKEGTIDGELTQVQHQELVDGIKLLDNSLLGQETSPETSGDNNNNFDRWPGIMAVSNAYSAYVPEYDTTHEQLMNKYNELELESVSLQKDRENIQKTLVVYHNRSMDISDKRRELQQSVEGVHSSLRTIMNL